MRMPVSVLLLEVTCLLTLTFDCSNASSPAPSGRRTVKGSGAAATRPGETSRIDRRAVVSRHNVLITRIVPNRPLQAGNGRFAFNTDGTGLQTFGGNILTDWAWHTSPLPGGVEPGDRAEVARTARHAA